MSHALGMCRFAGGEVRFFAYSGTADVCDERLRGSPEEVDAHWFEIGAARCTCGGDEDVTLFADYGAGFYWPARACRRCAAITDGRLPYELTGWPVHGRPAWVLAERCRTRLRRRFAVAGGRLIVDAEDRAARALAESDLRISGAMRAGSACYLHPGGRLRGPSPLRSLWDLQWRMRRARDLYCILTGEFPAPDDDPLDDFELD